MIRIVSAMVLFAVLTGCKPEAPPPAVVTVERPLPVLPIECSDARDSDWEPLPDRDVTRTEGARNYATNRARFRGIKSNRRICAATLRARGFPLR